RGGRRRRRRPLRTARHPGPRRDVGRTLRDPFVTRRGYGAAHPGSGGRVMAERRIRIVLADDHAIVLEGLRALLDSERDMDVVAATTDGSDVMALVKRQKPDVVVLDYELGGLRA